MTDNIKWLFFDVGSTIIDEHIACEHRMREIADLAKTTYNNVYETTISFIYAMLYTLHRMKY